MPAVPPLSYSARDYLKSFDVVAVAVSASGRVFVTTNPQNVTAAWWCKREHADAVAAAAWSSGDILEAARRLQVPLTAHSTVLRRVGERVGKIDEEIAKAIDRGVLREFNSQYRARRLAARKAGKRFMSYSEALRRLRATVAESVAKDGTISKSFIAAVFEEAPARIPKTNSQSDPVGSP